ncbi:MAG TPA: sulfate ABC transporter permease subunit CysT [Polyangiaceae bacterium]|nr:sulfate ABC transporter permease subunit CysT [Polyangiaceae bacterium]
MFEIATTKLGSEPPVLPAPNAPANGGRGPRRAANRGVLPGYRLTFGYVGVYLGLIVLIPMAALITKAAGLGWSEFWRVALDPRALAAYRLTFALSFAAAITNAIFGVIIAWVLTRYRFPGSRLADTAVDLPFALPTAVAGIALTSLYAKSGIFGGPLDQLGIKVAFAPVGIYVALTFIGIPFVVRTIQPVLEDLDPSLEEASAVLGAGRFYTFARVLFPALLPSMLTGFALAFARGVGEYGSVVFIAGNMPYKTEIAPLLIVTKLEQFQYAEATAIACVMLTVSFLSLLAINLLQRSRAVGIQR